jgi:tetratricopeptide (TPR) repeat protein
MNKIEEIIHILDEEEILPEEREYLNQVSTEDIELKKFIDVHLQLRETLNSNSHIDMEILAEFILYYDGDLDAAEYVPQITDKIEDHLSECDICNQLYINFNREFQRVNDYVTKAIIGSEEDFVDEKGPSIFSRIKRWNYRAALSAIILLLITYAGMKVTSYYSTPFYMKDIFSIEGQNNLLAHARASDSYKKGLIAFYQEEYQKSIGYLMEDIIKNPDDSTIFFSYYLLGLTYLKSSENDILGTFKSYNHIRVDNGIENLLLSVEKNNSGNFERLNLDAHYFVAKAYIAAEELELAREHLQIVVDERGKYFSSAFKILKSLDEIEKLKSGND